MYIITRALGLTAEFGGRYLPVMITNLSIAEVIETYQSVLVELKHTSTNEVYSLKISDLDPEIQASALSLPQWLVKYPTLALPTTDGPLKISYSYLNFYDAWLHEFGVNPINRNYHPEMEIAEELRIDLHLTKPTANYWNMGKYCLYTVNGMVHRGDANGDGVIVFNGAESAAVADDNQLGILDFQHLGEIEVIPITKDMVKTRGGLPLRDGAYIKLPKSMVGKVPLLVMGGFLHALDKVYTVVADDLIKINFTEYSWEIKYGEMTEYINVEPIGDMKLPNGITNMQLLWSDDVLRNLLSLPQSFIVLVDTMELHRGEIPLEYAALPGVYYGYAKPTFPILIGNGRLTEFRAELQHGVYAINTAGYLLSNLTRETTGFKAGIGYTEQQLPATPTRPATAKQLVLSKVLR